MNNWKEVPHLFCNGKFYVQCSGLFSDDYPPVIEGIDAINNSFIAERINAYIDDCTLIARPISDMSDGEVETLLKIDTDLETKEYEFADNGNRIFYREKATHNDWQYYGMVFSYDRCSIEQFLYLLSIGCYPFNQGHFKTGEVIARYENR